MDLNEAQILEHFRNASKFLGRYESLWKAPVVGFFQERLWEKVDANWLDTLKELPVDDLLMLPSCISQDHWPSTLREFLNTAQSLELPRKPDGSQDKSTIVQVSIDKILTQGMNPKKFHEIGLMATEIAAIAKEVHAVEIIDVGAGQGYLAQVLAFQHKLSVTAIECSAHNCDVTNARAERIRKYYEAQRRKSDCDDTRDLDLLGPCILKRHLGTAEGQISLGSLLSDDSQESHTEAGIKSRKGSASVVLAGLHACGDLSANMLRTFVEHDHVKAVVCVGCCYHLLSEGPNEASHFCGFPMSDGARALGLKLGRIGCDLACQSAERWANTGSHVALENFKVHGFRAAFQKVLHCLFPLVAASIPSVKRLGKTKRRKQAIRSMKSNDRQNSGGTMAISSLVLDDTKGNEDKCKQSEKNGLAESIDTNDLFREFEDYTDAALWRLKLPTIPRVTLHAIWKEAEPYLDYIGPFWSLRAVLGPVIESILLLDRLLFLKESAARTEDKGVLFCSKLVPLFEPHISPRNVAIICTKARAGDPF